MAQISEERDIRMMLDIAHVLGESKERGQGLVEYSLVLTFVSIALVGALVAVGGQSSGMYSHILSVLTAVVASL